MLPQSFNFTFAAPHLSHPLTFAPNPRTNNIVSIPTKLTPSTLKRPRPLPDADHLRSRKKRRLRLRLSTSRLSRPYSKPASHAVDRGSCKIAIWAAQKRMQAVGGAGKGRAALRKVAVLNSLRLRVLGERRGRRSPNFGPLGAERWRAEEEPELSDERETGAGEATMVAAVIGEGDTTAPPVGAEKCSPDQQRDVVESNVVQPPSPPSQYFTSQPPSPPGPSNYDALDDEDEYPGYAIPNSDSDDDDYYVAYRPHPDWAVQPSPPTPDSSNSEASTSLAQRTRTEIPLPAPSPSPSNCGQGDEAQQQPRTVVSPNLIGPGVVAATAAAAAACWKQMDDKRPPSPPDEGLLRLARERMAGPQTVEGGGRTGMRVATPAR